MKKAFKYLSTKDKPKQPEKCVNCIWGRWEGSKQFCSMIKCVKENEE